MEINTMLPTVIKRHVTSLKELLIKNIIKNMEQYITKDEEDLLKKDTLLTKILSKFKNKEEDVEQKNEDKFELLNDLRNEILETLLDQRWWDTNENKFQIHLKFLPNILNSHTKEVNLHSFMSLCPKPLQAAQTINVVGIIANCAPNIEVLSIGEDSLVDSISQKMKLTRKIIFDISRMTKLHTLKIYDFVIKLKNLMKICKNLQSLFYVDANIAIGSSFLFTEPEWRHLDFEESFSHLKVFTFRLFSLKGNSYTIKRFEDLTHQCIQRLPSLEIVQILAYVRRSYPGYSLPKTPPLAPSSLRHLCVFLRNSSFQFDQLASFPNVTHLLINMNPLETTDPPITREEIDALLQFKAHLKSLALFGCPTADILDRFLDRHGKNLHTLSVCNVRDLNLTYTFKKIFNACPKLETLVLMGVVMADQESLTSFAELKNLQWIELAPTKTVHLADVLRAPKLENFYMFDSNPDLEDINQVSTLISNKQIPSKLNKVRYISYCGPLMNSNSLLREVGNMSDSAFVSLLKFSAFETSFFQSSDFTDQSPLDRSDIAGAIIMKTDSLKVLREGGVTLHSQRFNLPSFIG